MPFTTENANKNLLHTGYPPRSCIDPMAEKIAEDLKTPSTASKYPFSSLEWCNVVSPQQLGQKPIKYVNEVLALCQNPRLLEEHSAAFSPEVVKRAREMIQSTGGSGLGAYTGSQGLPLVQRDVVKFITNRDTLPEGYISEKDVFLTDGASSGIKLCLQMFIDAKNPKNTGYLIPTPQYSLYRELLNSMGAVAVPYELKEDKGWIIHTEELERAFGNASASGLCIRGVVVINPGNPTGNLLTKQKMKEIIGFALSKDIMILADEVMQNTVSIGVNKFVSFQKAVYDVEHESMDTESKVSPQLISFNSFSKGDVAYGGIRAGYFTLHNFDINIKAIFTKMVSINLCPNTTGQILVSLATRGPTKGTEEEAQYNKERSDNLAALGRSMESAYTRLNYAKGIVCQPIRGGIYAYPRITVPPKAVEAAKKIGLTPSEFYCKCLLDRTGIVVVPGSSFMNITGKQYVRISLICDTARFTKILDRLVLFNDSWVAQHE